VIVLQNFIYFYTWSRNIFI